jgi:hypothetical protein
MLENAADRVKEQSSATIAQPKRIGARHPTRPAVRPAERSEDGVHALLGNLEPTRTTAKKEATINLTRFYTQP